MAIIKPKPKQEKEQIRIQVDSQILAEVNRYCEYAGFKKPEDFFEEAALHILTKDKEFKEWKEKSSVPQVAI
jgi:hypothetical protein